jgi:predicted RND superfamily exporter protein
VQANFNYTEDYFVAVEESFDGLKALVEELEVVDGVYRVESILDYLPEDQERKLDLIQQVLQANPGLANVSHLQLGLMTWTDLPEDVHKGFVSNSSGHERYLVRIIMEGDINDEAYRDRVLPLLQELNEGVTGQAIMFPIIMDSITEDVGRVSVFAIVPILLIVYVGLGRANPKYALLAMLPVAFGILGIMSLYEYLNVTLSVISILTVPLVIGIAIDNGIHLVHRYLEEGEGSIPHVVQHTGRAVFLTSATTILAFSSFMIAEHPGIMSLGRVPVLGLSVGLLASLVFLPAVMRASLERGGRAGQDKDPGTAGERTA